MNIYKGKKVIITGHTGFKGAWLSIWLHLQGAKVVGISKDIPTSPSIFELLNLPQYIQHHFCDLRNKEKFSQLIENIQPDFIFHLAAQTLVGESYANPLENFSSNVMGACYLLDILRSMPHPCTAIFVSSDKAYENREWTWGYRENDRLGGKDPYSASKAAMEIIIKSYYHSFFKRQGSPIRIGIVRAGNVIGGGDWAKDRLIPDCMRAWSKGESVLLRHPQATRPWQHVLEPLSGYLELGARLTEDESLNGEAFNFGPIEAQSYSVLELLQAMSVHWSIKSGHNFYEVQQKSEYHEAGLLRVNCDKAAHILKWKPCWNFQQTADITSQWYQHYYQKGEAGLWDLSVSQIQKYQDAYERKNYR